MIKGIFPPIPTPFEDNEISTEKLRCNIEKWNKTNLAGYVVMGSNGESVFLSKDEKIKLISAVKEFSLKEKIIIAGTGSDSIKDTIELSKNAAVAGADYVLVLTPSYYSSKMNHTALIEYFTQVADNISVPLLIYNVPKFTNVNIPADTVAKLAEHENIVGIKSSSENIADLLEIVSVVPEDFSVLVGTASVLYSGLNVGAVGGIMALANIAPDECVSILENYAVNNYSEALAIQQRMIKPNRAVTSQFGVAGLKYALDLQGFFGGLPRKPLQPLNHNEKEIVEKILSDAELLN